MRSTQQHHLRSFTTIANNFPGRRSSGCSERFSPRYSSPAGFSQDITRCRGWPSSNFLGTSHRPGQLHGGHPLHRLAALSLHHLVRPRHDLLPQNHKSPLTPYSREPFLRVFAGWMDEWFLESWSTQLRLGRPWHRFLVSSPAWKPRARTSRNSKRINYIVRWTPSCEPTFALVVMALKSAPHIPSSVSTRRPRDGDFGKCA